MSRILVVEDDADIASLIVHYLVPAGHESEVVANGSDALPAARRHPPDLIILDRMLPGLDGLEICRALRADADLGGVPILMLTARAEEVGPHRRLRDGRRRLRHQAVQPEGAGGAHRRAAPARPARGPADERVLRYGPLVIDVERHVVTDGDREVRLTAKEYLLLHYFLEHRGRVLSRDLLLTDVWGYQYTGGTRTVDVHVRRLREKLPMLVQAVETIKQFGYKLKADGPDGDAS